MCSDVRTRLRLLPLVALSVVFAIAAACQPVPRPFAPAAKVNPGDNGLVLSPRAGLVVRPPQGLPQPLAGELSSRLVSALRHHDITAMTGKGHRAAAVLNGQWSDDSVEWEIVEADGTIAVQLLQPLQADRGPPESYAEEDWFGLANTAADMLDMALREVEQGSTRRMSFAAVRLGPIDGAPGNGRLALAAELRRSLRDAGVTVPASEDIDALTLVGSVHVGSSLGRRQPVEIVWQLLRTDGVELGRLVQRNDIASGELDGPWGALARDIANAATDGIVQLLRQVGDRPA